MTRRGFGQYCGLARALELVGERWALLIIRDLAVRPRRYSDLLSGLPGIPTNVLSTRLKELEQSGVVERRIAPSPQRGVVYALTSNGRNLEPALFALGRWGVTQLEEPRPGEIVTAESLAINMRAAFNPEMAAGLTASWEVRAHDIQLHVVVSGGELGVGLGPAPGTPDLTVTFQLDGLPSLHALLQAARRGMVEMAGRPELLDMFVRVFTRQQVGQFGR